MWEWFVINGVWILIAAAIFLVLLIIAREWVQKGLEKTPLAKRSDKFPRIIKLVIAIVGIIDLLIAVIALAAITLSKRGVNTVITIETIQKWLLEHGILIFIVVLISYLIYRFLRMILPELIERSVKGSRKGRRAREEAAKRAHTVSDIITSTVGIIILLIAVFIILSDVGVDVTPLLAGAGVAGIAIGFGAQSLVRDIVSGLLIMLEDQYSKGDVVKIAGELGVVEEINLRRTVLRDLDGIVHSVPNGEIKIASNYTKEWARVNLNIPVAYGEDLDKVTEILNRVGVELAEDEVYGPMIRTAPKVLRVDKFGDSAIEIKVLGETKAMKQWEVMGALRKRIKRVFDEEGIEIPWPHVKLYLGQNQSNELETCKTCNQPNLRGSKFCSNCGTSLASPK